jgi:hypothetical protein
LEDAKERWEEVKKQAQANLCANRPKWNGAAKNDEIADGITTLIVRETSFAGTQSIVELIFWGASFRDPYTAFPAAMCVQLAVAWTADNGARQIHWPPAGRAQMLSKNLAIPTYGRVNGS